MIYDIQNKRLKNGPLDVNYDIIQDFSFNVGTENIAGVHYIACGLELNKAPSALLFYSEDYSYDDDILTFTVNTYTENFLTKVTKFATKAWLEIGIIGETKKEIILFDDIIVNPRVYIEGETPQPIPSSEYATRAWVAEFYQPLITEDHKLDGSLISGITPGEGVSSGWVDENYEKKITNDRKLSYSLLSGTPTIPTVNNSQISLTINGVTSSFTLNQASNKSIEFVVEGGGGEGVTSAYVIQKISDHNLSVDAHSSLFNAKQNVINNNNKLSYSLLSGTPSIPTKTSDLTNDSNFATSAYVTEKISDHNSAADAHSSLFNAKQNVINNNNKLAYSLLSGTPTIPTVNNATITLTQGGVTKGSFTLNQSTAKTIDLDVGGGSTPGSGIITLIQGGVTKGSFNVNQSSNQSIFLDSGGGGGSMMYSQIYSSDTVLTAFHDCSYFWALQNQNATLYCENLQQANYDIPIDINLSGSTVTLSGITRIGILADGMLNRCLITKRYDKTLLYVYSYDLGYDMTQGLVGNWTTLGTDSSTYAGAAQVYTETTAGHYDSADGTYFIEVRGTNWRLFTSDDTDIAMGPLASDPMQGEYATVNTAPLAGDSVLTVKLENIIVPD